MSDLLKDGSLLELAHALSARRLPEATRLVCQGLEPESLAVRQLPFCVPGYAENECRLDHFGQLDVLYG